MSADEKQYYKTLGVNKDASADDIRKAYRKLVKENHPDVSSAPDAAKKFAKIQEAYDCVSNPDKRAVYDRGGNGHFGGGGNGGFDPFGGGFGGFSQGHASFGFGDDVLSELLKQFTHQGGGSRQRSSSKRQAAQTQADLDIVLGYNVSLKQAYTGDTVVVSFDAYRKCGSCTGTGGKKVKTVCSSCNGRGSISQNHIFVSFSSPCEDCNSTGSRETYSCHDCNGLGCVLTSVTESINIPSGIYSGVRLRVSGKGNQGFRGGIIGDLYLKINVLADNAFTLKENNLHMTTEIPLHIAILGGNIDLHHLDGAVISVAIPVGTQPQKDIICRGKGMPILQKDKFGDLVIKVDVILPTNLTPEQQKKFQEFSNTLTDTNYGAQGKKSWFDRFKKMF